MATIDNGGLCLISDVTTVNDRFHEKIGKEVILIEIFSFSTTLKINH